jgi:4'-phosphopantetheinyl transferase
MTKLRIYAVEYPGPMPAPYSRLLENLPAGLKNKALQYRRWQDAYGCILGKHLLRIGLEEEGLGITLDALKYTAYSKPYFDGGPHFSISHSGNRVVCTINRWGGVGIDLEEIRELPISDFRGQFSEKEWADIIGAEDTVARFFSYWTAKESLIKADGRGLQIPLPELDVHTNPVRLDDSYWHLSPVQGFEGYACHVATPDPSPAIEVLEMGATEMADSYIRGPA